MRQINFLQIGTFMILTLTGIGLGVSVAELPMRWLVGSKFNPSGIGLILYITCAFLGLMTVYRTFLLLMPLQEGHLSPGSKGEFVAQVNILFYLIFFNLFVRTNLLPVPMMRLFYQALGTKMGTNTYSAGALLDPPLTSLGDNCIVGHNAVVIAHAIEGPRFALARVRIGNNVTIGAMAIIMAGVTIEDDAIVSAGAVVRKDTHIRQGEIWGGVPARRLGKRGEPGVDGA